MYVDHPIALNIDEQTEPFHFHKGSAVTFGSNGAEHSLTMTQQ